MFSHYPALEVISLSIVVINVSGHSRTLNGWVRMRTCYVLWSCLVIQLQNRCMTGLNQKFQATWGTASTIPYMSADSFQVQAYTEWGFNIPRRKWKKTEPEPGTVRLSNMISCLSSLPFPVLNPEYLLVTPVLADPQPNNQWKINGTWVSETVSLTR